MPGLYESLPLVLVAPDIRSPPALNLASFSKPSFCYTRRHSHRSWELGLGNTSFGLTKALRTCATQLQTEYEMASLKTRKIHLLLWRPWKVHTMAW